MTDAGLHRRAGVLFDELADLGPAERADALARAAAADPAAAAYAERMLAADRLERAGGLAALDPIPAPADDPAQVLGASIGHHVIRRLLGRGGMGAVYLARREAPAEEVAVKFLTLGRAPAEALERFRRETEWLAAVDHPNVVRYRGSGVDRRGRPYLVMDFAGTEHLSHEVPEVAADVRRAVDLVIQAAGAVHHLHQRGVLHRDLKPSNILLARRDGAPAPVVVDLGIARALAADGSETIGFGPVGTPGFMSPEQWGGSRTPDVRIDVYALGAVLYALLTGRPPAGAADGGRPAAPSAAVDPAAFASAAARSRRIDADLDAVVLRALERLPADRYGSAEAFADDLVRWRDGFPVQARRSGAVGRLRRLVRRRPLESLVVAASCLTLVATSVITTRSLQRERATRRDYEDQLRVNEQTLAFFGDEVFARARPENDGPEAPVVDVLRGALESFGDEGAERPDEVMINVGMNLLAIFTTLDLQEDVARVLEKAAPFAEGLDGTDPLRLLFDLERGKALAAQERFDEAEALLLELWQRLEGAERATAHVASSHGSVRARAAQLLGVVNEQQDELERAEAWFDVGLRHVGTTAEDEDARLYLLYGRALTQMRAGRHDESIASYRGLLDAFAARYGPDSLNAMACLATLGGLYLRVGEPRLAVDHARRAVAIGDRLLAPDHQSRLIALSTLRTGLAELGEVAEAIAAGAEVVDGCRARYGPASAELREEGRALVAIQLGAGRGADAVALARELAASAARAADAGEAAAADVAAARVQLARAELAAGRPAEARDQAERALARLDGVADVAELAELARRTRDEAARAALE